MKALPLERESVYAESSFARRGILETWDPCLCEQYSGAWDVCVAPTDRSKFHNRKDYFVTPGITIYRDEYAGAVQISGALEQGLIALILPIQDEGASRYFNSFSRAGQIPVTESTSVTGNFGAHEEHIIVLLKLHFLEQVIAPEILDQLLQSGKTHWLPVTTSGRRGLVQWLLELLQQLERMPQIIENPLAVVELEKDCVNQLVAAIARAEGKVVSGTTSTRQRGFQKALELLSCQNGSTFTIPELCRFASVSQRTLEYAFLENMGVSPVRFAKTQRYHRLRRKLLKHSRGEISIQDIALGLGLYQLGRVSAEYRALFGENPSDTLRRNVGFNPAGIISIA